MKIIIVLYCLSAMILMIYGINCHILASLFRRGYRKQKEADQALLDQFYGNKPPSEGWQAMKDRFPVVTTQLPIYNERAVAERLIDAVVAFEYPEGKHEIQVLDDSTDKTRGMIADKVAHLRQQGIDIRHVTREHRIGYKAGALREGLEIARGQYVAVFDADFVPPSDFLIRGMPYFVEDPEIGFVQGRWGHLNRKENMITRLQSIGINGHFMIEQTARNASGLYLNFNGTAGIFSKQAIIEAGNWQDDTLTEDMDLSYRIQLAGWSRRFLPDLVAPAEIPSNINAFKNQQFRWAKGSMQTAIKLLPRVMASPSRPFAKFQAIMHMTHYAVHPLMLFLSTMAVPVIVSGKLTIPGSVFFIFGIMLLASCSGPSILYLTAERSLKNGLFQTLLLLPIMVSFGCGQAVNNSRAVLEAVFGKQSGFVRTPKKGILSTMPYIPNRGWVFVLEILAGVWCFLGTIIYFQAEHLLVGHFLLVYAVGFWFIGILSWHHGRRS
jgi:cellulose synthase/poly-beta-1,6-N-acetylglucosamine synthase-like glycosyltransferase